MEIVRESIFISSVRSFFKTLFGSVGIFIAFIPFFIIVAAVSSGSRNMYDKNIFTTIPDLNGENKLLPSSAPAILSINIDGIIGKDDLTSKIIESQLIESRKGLLQKNRVKGVLVHIRTPGGSVVDSDNIYQMLLDYKKKYNVPIYAYADGICASGGMYVASAADKIFASRVSVIGSVGVIAGPFFNIHDTLNKWGVKSLTLTEGKDKDSLSPFRPWKENEDKFIKDICAFLYQNFVDIVTQARPMLDKEKLVEEYGANIFNAQKAQEYGYIDYGNASYAETLSALLQAAQIDEKKPYQVVELQPRSKWLAEFFKGESVIGKMMRKFLQIETKENIWDNFAYLYQP